jgi:hypothetical protein
MWQTPLSTVSGLNLTPLPSSSVRAAATSSTCRATGWLWRWNSIPNASDCMTAIVSVPVSNSPAGISPQPLEKGRPRTSP